MFLNRKRALQLVKLWIFYRNVKRHHTLLVRIRPWHIVTPWVANARLTRRPYQYQNASKNIITHTKLLYYYYLPTPEINLGLVVSP